MYVSCNEHTSSYQVTGQLLVELSADVTERPNGYAPDILYSRLFSRLAPRDMRRDEFEGEGRSRRARAHVV